MSLGRGRIAGLIATAGIALGLAAHAVLVALGAGAAIRAIPAGTRSVALQLATLGTVAVAVASIVHSAIVIAADQSGRWIADDRMRRIIRRNAILARNRLEEER